MSAYQSQQREVILRLLNSGVPVTGVLNTDITAKIKKSGETAFAALSVTSTTWTEIENGFYSLRLLEGDTNVLGPLLLYITGSSFDPVTVEFDIDPQPLTVCAAPGTCIVTGNLVDLGGSPAMGARVVFRSALGTQIIGTSFLSSSGADICPDASGSFSVPLLRGAEVIVEIPSAGIKYKLTVPDQETAALLDLIPGLP